MSDFDLGQEAVIQTERMERAKGALLEYGVDVEKSTLLSQPREVVEGFRAPWTPDRRSYGAVPHFDKRDEIIKHFPEEAAFFAQHYTPGDKSRPAWMDPSYGEGTLLFEMKFGKRLSEFCKEILENYPDLQKDKPGKEISVFGLSGAGKSTVVEVMREKLGAGTIVIDSDTVRFNLMGKMMKDVEMAGGATLDEVRGQLIHNNISGPLYFGLNYVIKELKARGYDVVQSSTQPMAGADVTLYVEHPDGIKPEEISADDVAKIGEVAHTLFERTQGRISGSDNYDWDNAKTVTRFEDMVGVSVQVPEKVHNIFVKNVGETLRRAPEGSIQRVHNEKIDDSEARRQALEREVERLLGA